AGRTRARGADRSARRPAGRGRAAVGSRARPTPRPRRRRARPASTPPPRACRAPPPAPRRSRPTGSRPAPPVRVSVRAGSRLAVACCSSMRLLLLSDTHGHLTSIDALARDAGADAVVHAGDFGFYDEGSADRLEARELFLRVVHSELPPDQRKQA